jgi:ABC-type glycerol-3-phosphate transport system substrate-binding protein
VGRSIRLVVLALVAALALAACGGNDEEAPKATATDSSSPQVVADGSLAAGEKVAAPKGDVVLTVSGDIGTANKGKTLALAWPAWSRCARSASRRPSRSSSAG